MALWTFTLIFLVSSVAVLARCFPPLQRIATSIFIATFFFRHGPEGFLRLKEKCAGDIFYLGKKNLVIFKLSLIKHCLVGNPCNYDKGGRAARLMGDVVGPSGILGALDENDHKPSYQVLNPHTKRSDRLQDFEDLVLEETNNMLKELGYGEVDIYISFNRVFFKVLYRFMFGFDLIEESFCELIHVISCLERFSAVVGFVPAKLLPLYLWYRKDIPPLIKALDSIVENIVDKAAPGSPLAELQHPSIHITPAQLKDTIKNLLFAGATTAANSLGWAVHLISRKKNRHFRERAAVAAKAQDLNFFKNVCLETNRIYPQANVVTRRALNAEMVDGVKILKGTVLIIPIIALHRDQHYFKQPSRFDPDRWDHEKVPPLMSYIPFTAGPRQCIGQSLFNRAGPLFLMRLFAQCSFTPLNDNAKPEWPNAVLPPQAEGFKMEVVAA